jgi:hypothetical protein
MQLAAAASARQPDGQPNTPRVGDAAGAAEADAAELLLSASGAAKP